MINWAGSAPRDLQRVLPVLQAVHARTSLRTDPVDLVETLDVDLGEISELLRDARMLGLVTGTVRKRSSVDLLDVRLTPKARSVLRTLHATTGRPAATARMDAS